MKSTYVSINGQFPTGLTALYVEVHHHAAELNISYMVVGAMARDLVFVHGFGANIERGTRDVDFAICVESWEQFNKLSSSLVTSGFRRDPKVSHRFHRDCSDGLSWELDIIPFGKVAEDYSIAWPPSGEFVMNVLGFQEALEHSWIVEIQSEPKVAIPVCSPVGISLLKLVAWLDREGDKRKKDAIDLLYIMRTYSKIGTVFDALYDDGFMDESNFDELQATASKLGSDAGKMASLDTLHFLNLNLFAKEEQVEVLAREMGHASSIGYEEALACLRRYGQHLLAIVNQ